MHFLVLSLLLFEVTIQLDGSTPMDFTVMDGAVYFHANDGINGRHIYVYEAGEVRSFLPHQIEVDREETFAHIYRGLLYFSAKDDLGYGFWATDGTVEGTTLVMRPEGDLKARIIGIFDNQIYYSQLESCRYVEIPPRPSSPGYSWTERDYILRTHHLVTGEGQVLIDYLNASYTRPPKILGRSKGRLLMCGPSPNQSAWIPYITNGSQEDTRNLANPRDWLHSDSDIVAFEDEYYIFGRGWLAAMTGQQMRKIIEHVADDRRLHPVAGGMVYIYQRELWFSGGRYYNTHNLALPGDLYSQAAFVTSVGDGILGSRIYQEEARLWRTDREGEEAVAIAEIAEGPYSDYVSEGVSFFHDGRVLWRTDGSADGTQVIYDNLRHSENTSLDGAVRVDQQVLFLLNGELGILDLEQEQVSRKRLWRKRDYVPVSNDIRRSPARR